MTPTEDFAALAALIRTGNGPLPPNSRETILAALDLASVGLAAVAYHSSHSGPFSAESYLTWDRFDEAALIYKETRK